MNRLPFLLLALGCMFAIASCGPGNSTNTPGNPGNAAIAEPDKGDDKAGGDTAKETDDADDPPPAESELVTTRKAMVEEAWGYLKGEYNCAPTEDDPYALKSGWGPESTNVPYTALALQGLVGAHVWDADNAMIKDSVDWLLSVQEPTGAWSYRPNIDDFKGIRAVYITSIMAQLLVELNEIEGPWKGKLNNEIASASEYLQQSQVGNANGPAPDYEENQVGFGGWAYSKEEIEHNVEGRGKPASNLSTSTFAIEALHACGVSKDDPLWNDALTFLKRNQNAGEVQDEGFEAMHQGKPIKMAGEGSQDYGGAIYSEETSKADGLIENEDGTVTLFSYGSMTYNLLRSYIFAGMDRDALPAKLAWGWIQRNYTVERVPGFRDEAQYDMGLYYYYLSMAKTLDALDVDVVEEPERGLKHHWRQDLVTELNERQNNDGSWVNENHTRWQEDSKVLCTGYILNALKHTKE